jgi:hypothetical protein
MRRSSRPSIPDLPDVQPSAAKAQKERAKHLNPEPKSGVRQTEGIRQKIAPRQTEELAHGLREDLEKTILPPPIADNLNNEPENMGSEKLGGGKEKRLSADKTGSGERDVIQPLSETRESVRAVAGMPENSRISLADIRYSVPPDHRPPELDMEKIDRIRKIHAEDTLEAHREAYRLLLEMRLMALNGWEREYRKKEGDAEREHANLSIIDPSIYNGLAELIVERWRWKPYSVVMEYGSGAGNALIYIARHTDASCLGMDSAPTATAINRENIALVQRQIDAGLIEIPHDKKRRIENQITLIGDCDYIEESKAMRNMQADVIACQSAGNYWPPRMVQQENMPLAASRLAPRGEYYTVMKMASSPTAQAPYQLRLGGGPYHPSLNLRDNIFRFYVESKEAFLELVEPTFKTVLCREVVMRNYERMGEDEIGIEYVGRKRRRPKYVYPPVD